MYFLHSNEVWNQFPGLAALVLVVRQVRAAELKAGALDDAFAKVAASLEAKPESEFPPIQAWRQAYAEMGLKPTQYRCAAEALLRRFRKDQNLPNFHLPFRKRIFACIGVKKINGEPLIFCVAVIRLILHDGLHVVTFTRRASVELRTQLNGESNANHLAARLLHQSDCGERGTAGC